MFDWHSKYGDLLKDAETAVKDIKSGDFIVTGMMEPVELLRALKNRDDLKNVMLFCAQSLQGMIGEVANETKSDIRAVTPFIDPHPNLQKAKDAGKVDFMPASFSSWAKINKSVTNCNVLLLTITPPDKNGYVTLSTYPEHVVSLLDTADVVIGEVNENVPITYGCPVMHVSRFTSIVESKTNWNFLIRDEVGEYWKDEQAKQMGGYLSELVEDGATIELGVGGMNGNAILNMEGVKDLGIHTEYFGDVLMELMKKGVVNNSRKSINKGFSVATMGSGSKKFYEFVHENRAVRFMPCEYVLKMSVMTANSKFTAINTASQIDLQGQINGEFIKGKQYSGIGGQGDFAKAACSVPDGKSIMAIASTTKNGKYSKIVPCYENRLTPITTTRNDVEYVVTEFGIAQLLGQTLPQRVKNLISIAHPKFRDELTEEAKKIGLI